MHKIVLITLCSLLVFGCSTTKKERAIASEHRSLNGTLLGVTNYTNLKDKKRIRKSRAVRLYLSEIEGEPGSYNAVLLEYVNLLHMAPKYIASNKLPRLSRIIGFLNQITSRITTYKVTPTGTEGKYEMQKYKVKGDKILASSHKDPSYLYISEKRYKNPIEGASIKSATGGEEKPIFFPSKSSKKNFGVQYSLANFTYDKVGLESTWRKSFLKGPYLGAYGDKDDKILELNADDQGDYAHFIINEKRAHLPRKAREAQLTNPKSARIFGSYKVTEPRNGMFLFRPLENGNPGQRHVVGRIGLFIDIFDATKKLNQDVVELVLIDPNNSNDFLMYYEHPDNGEGG